MAEETLSDTLYLVVRKCCLGPCCSHGHLPDNQVLVAQILTYNKGFAEKCAANWHEYKAVLKVLSEEVLETLEPVSAQYVRDKRASGRIHPLYGNKG